MQATVIRQIITSRTSLRLSTLLAAAFAVAAIMVLALRLADSQTAVKALQRANATQMASLRHNRHVLQQLCDTNAVLEGIVAQSLILFRTELNSEQLPVSVRSAYRDILATFAGYQAQLQRQTACEEVTKP